MEKEHRKTKEEKPSPSPAAAPLLPRKSIIAVNPALCVGCRLCEIACSTKKEGSISPAASRIRIYQFYPGPMDIPVLCHQCSDYPCKAACPPKVAAISIDAKTGAVLIDAAKCVGVKCSLCAKACRHKSAITFSPQSKKALVCDLCQGAPQCVAVCPTQALSYIGATFDGLHYAVPPEEIAESMAARFYPAPRKL